MRTGGTRPFVGTFKRLDRKYFNVTIVTGTVRKGINV